MFELIFFWLKWAGYLAVAGLNLLAQISDRSPFDVCKIACDHAHSFTHQKGLSYQIFELED